MILLLMIAALALTVASIRAVNSLDYTDRDDLAFFFFMDFGIIMGFVICFPIIVVVTIVYWIGYSLCE